MVLKSAGLAGLLLLAASPGAETQDLVARLGSAKYAEREAASVALEKLGQAAFPVLKAARADKDPEVKNRAEVLIDSIERSLVARPATVSFEARRYLLAEIVEMLSKAEGMPLQLADFAETPGTVRTLVMRSPEALGFWPLMERLGLEPQWEIENDFGQFGPRRSTVLRLGPRTDSGLPTSHSGAFRLIARTPGYVPDALQLDAGGRFQAQRGARVRRDASRDGELVIPIEVTCEPRLTFRSTGPIRVLEAVDDRGEPIAPAPPDGLDNGLSANAERFASTATGPVRLRPSGGPHKSLERLRGVIPVEVRARKTEPIVIPLDPQSLAEHRPVVCGGESIQVHGLTPPGLNFSGGWVVEMTIRRDEWNLAGMGGFNGRRWNGRLWEVMNGDGERFWQNLEFYDAQGLPFRRGTPRPPIGRDADGLRIMLALPARDDPDEPPAKLRFYGQIQTPMDIPFEFRDLKLP